MANTTTNALLDNLRTKVPGAPDTALKLEIYNTVDELCREALRTTAPTNVDAEPDTWLSSDLWVPNYQCILEGALARLYGQPAKPWSSAELAKAHGERYSTYLQLARTLGVDDVTSVYDRLIKAIHTQIPGIREGAIKLALFGVANRVRIEGLRLAALDDSDNDPETWIPEAQWEESYLALFHGTLSRLQMQGGQPWTNTDLAGANDGLFQAELQELRASQITPSIVIAQRLKDRVRAALPGARDEAIALELFDVADSACRTGRIWREVYELDLVADQEEYEISIPTGRKVVTVYKIVHDNTSITMANCYYDLAENILTFRDYIPDATDVATDPVAYITFAFAPETDIEDITVATLERYYDLFLAGVMHRLMSHVGKPYSNPARAMQYQRQYHVLLARARRDAEIEGLYGAAHWRFPKFA